jgi:hypothetical protein
MYNIYRIHKTPPPGPAGVSLYVVLAQHGMPPGARGADAAGGGDAARPVLAYFFR